MDDFWKKIYDLIQTPLPPPKQLELDKLFEYLRSVETPTIPELPTAPEWVKRYAEEHGLDRIPPATQEAPKPQSGFSLWDTLHPEGIGSTNRSFNAIYPPLGR
jgi:hypothetical protein